jgi:hypothetical protein
MIWLMLFIVFFAIEKIADKCVIISLVGLLGNLAGALLFKITDRRGRISSEDNK